jgi:hypothetical protein
MSATGKSKLAISKLVILLPLLMRNEWGEGRGEGLLINNILLTPALSSFSGGEGEDIWLSLNQFISIT